jgi:hypothetical protein
VQNSFGSPRNLYKTSFSSLEAAVFVDETAIDGNCEDVEDSFIRRELRHLCPLHPEPQWPVSDMRLLRQIGKPHVGVGCFAQKGFKVWYLFSKISICMVTPCTAEGFSYSGSEIAIMGR